MLLRTETADLDPEAFFTESELQMMDVYARNYNLTPYKDFKGAILMVALMGGYMNRIHDPPPGREIMWRGCAQLQMRAITYEELTSASDLVERTH